MTRRADMKARLIIARAKMSEPSFGVIQSATIKAALEHEAAKPMRGGNAAPPAKGLFDENERNQISLF